MEYWYAITGPKHWQELHAAHMQSVDMFIPATAPNGQTFQQGIKGIYEPIQIVRYIFPREALPIVVNTLGSQPDKGILQNLGMEALRKMIGLQDIPVVEKSAARLPVSMDFLNIIPLGIKDDGPDRLIFPTGVKQEPI